MRKGVTPLIRHRRKRQCPRDGKEARLIVNLTNKRQPVRDAGGNLQYYCVSCHHRFSVNTHGQVTPP